jgi:hypothetical protein
MLRKMAAQVAFAKTSPRWAKESDLDELGMSATYGPDQDSMSTHTEIEEEDLETTETRTSIKRKDGGCGGSCKCGPGCPGKNECPNCGGKLVKLEGY